MENKRKTLFFSILIGLFFLALPARAVCPVCTIAVGAGVGLAEEFGVDDVIIGLWIGGLTVSLIFWTLDWFQRKKINFKSRGFTTAAAYYLLIIFPLFFMKVKGDPIIGKAFNKIWGFDKILVGTVLGSLFFWGGAELYEYLKKKNHDRAHFPFEKVVMPITPLLILSLIFYFIT